MARNSGRKPADPKWRRRKDDRPAEIIAAALEVFSRRGFAAARLEEIAAQAGVSKGTLYLYFRSKEELFKAMVRELLVPTIVEVEQQVAGEAGGTSELLAGVLRGMVEVIASPVGAIPKLVIAEAGNFPDLARFYAEEVVGRGMGVVSRLVARGVERGEFRAIDPAGAAPVVIAPLLLLAMWKHALEPHAPARARALFDPRSFVATYTDLVLNGLRSVPAKAGA